MKKGGVKSQWWVDRGNLLLSKIKQYMGDSVLKRMKNIKNGLSFQLVSSKVMLKMFDVLRKKQVISQYGSQKRRSRKCI